MSTHEQQQEYPDEEQYPQEQQNRDVADDDDGDVYRDFHMVPDDGSVEPSQTDDDAEEEEESETPTEEHERRGREAATVWFSGFMSGYSYVAKPKYVNEDELSDMAKEELLAEKAYVVPRGYRYRDDTIPPILMAKPTGFLLTSLIIYIVLSFVAFVFLLVAACPIPWYKGKNKTVDGVNYKGRKFQLWQQKGGDLPYISLRNLHDCPIEKQFMQTIGASVIMGCAFTVAAMVSAIVKVCGKGNYGWTLLFGFLALTWSLCGNAMSISAYHLSRCQKPRFVTVSTLDAGFALSLVAWVLLLVGLLIVFFATHGNIGPAMRDVRVMDTYFLLLIWLSIAFCVIANGTTIWKRKFNDETVRVSRVTYWHSEVIHGNSTNVIFGRAQYRCSAYNKRIKASISFLILGTVTLGLSALLGIGSYTIRAMRLGACICGVISSVFLFVSWVTSVAVFYRELCTNPVTGSLYANYPGVPSGVYNGYTKFEGYGLAEGVALVIVAWIFSTFAVVMNFVVPWPVVKTFGE